MSDDITLQDNSWAENNPYTGSITGGEFQSEGIPLTSSNGMYLLSPEVERYILKRGVINVAKSLSDEKRLYQLLHYKEYSEDEREWLRDLIYLTF
jgi:hypothetical protein